MIDKSNNAVYVTGSCETTSGNITTERWYIHKVSLLTGQDLVTPPVQITGSATGSDGADDLVGSSIPFVPYELLQRPALLKVAVSGAQPSSLIYVAFGWGSAEEKGDAYHGWIFGYDSSLTQQFAFVTSAKGTSGNTDFPACNASCTACSPPTQSNPIGCTPAAGCLVSGYTGSANWCGHGGGIWMSGRGGAANTLSGVSHAYFAVGNGPFQQNAVSQSGALLNRIQNWGDSVVDFTLSQSGGAGPAPSEYFTPYGYPLTPTPVQEPLGTSSYTSLGMNQNDFDLGTGGILLLDDLAGVHRLLTFDKAGYGYFMAQGNLCGSSPCYPGTSSSGTPGFQSGDPGNAFPFAANLTQCTNQTHPHDCDRITSMAFNPDSSPERLYVWPSYEKLASLALSNNQPINSPTGTAIGSNGTTVCGSGTTFTTEVVPGDTLTDTGSANPNQSVTVIKVISDTQLQVSQSFTHNIGSCTSTCSCSSTPDTYSYSGYFVNPIYDVRPSGSGTNNTVNYPGGTVVVTSNSGTGSVVWALASLGTTPYGTLLAYDAANLKFIWCSNTLDLYCDASSAFTASLFALPTVVNGYTYVPNSGITQVPSTSNSASTCNTSPGCAGVLVYSGH